MAHSISHRADPTLPSRKGTIWERRFRDLDAFVRREGRLPNSHFASPEERSLRSWLSTQRMAHSGLGTATLTAEHERALETIPGWEW
jgi:hypothetical protein